MLRPPLPWASPMLEFFDTLTLLLTAAAFIAGIIDSIAGGGGMITIPALLLAGIPPVEALFGTNKLQGLFGSSSATIAYARKGHVNIKEQWPEALASLIGSVFGALLATVLPVDIMRAALPILLIAIALYFCHQAEPWRC